MMGDTPGPTTTTTDPPGRVPARVPSPSQWVAALALAVLCAVVGVWAQVPVVLVAAVALLAVVGAVMAAIDVACHRLPDRLSALLAVGVLGAAIVHSLAVASVVPVVRTVGGMGVVFVVMAVLVVAGSGIGGGDVKFSAAVSGAPALVGSVAAAGLGLAVGLVVVGAAALLARKRGRDVVVFGPGLFTGALLVALVGLGAW